MHVSKSIRVFSLRHPLIGPTFWMLSIQYFVTQLVVADAWKIPFNYRLNPISDLGNTECGLHEFRYVCSPMFSWMNSSFVVLGVTIVIGSIFLYQSFHKSKGSLIGFYFMALAGLGTVLVGLFPENSIPALHTVGAILPFLFGNLSLIVLGLSLHLSTSFKWFTIGFGLLALLALLLFANGTYLWFGLGGMERLVAYPQTIWLIVFGAYVSRNRYRTIRQRHKA